MRKLFWIIVMFVGAFGAFKLKQVLAAVIVVVAAVLIDLSFSSFRKTTEIMPGIGILQKIKNWFKT